MLAGGGLKIAFQAGVLQVWLDEAGIEFDHADAVSAATFNLAMWAQGMSGTQIADNWRNFNPIAAVKVNWSQLPRLFHAESLFKLDAFRRKFFPAWGLDWEKIRASGREATFNVYNFSKHDLRPVTPPEMTEAFLIAAASLPIWFPPVRIDGDTYIDAVFNTASNLEEAIRRGADELWVIWTTSSRGAWLNGFGGNFFGIFEATTNGGYKRVLARIETNNAAIERGAQGEFRRRITVRELRSEVALHYLFNFKKDRFAAAVNRGAETARAWCDTNGVTRIAVRARSPLGSKGLMKAKYFGAESMTEEDRGYRGSRFSEVRDALFANPYEDVWGRAGQPPLPTYKVTLSSVLRGILPFGKPYLFRQATERAVDSDADLRWGPDGNGFRRLLHPNGVCLTGLWEITEETGYSGYFRQGNQALVVGRYSTCCTETRRGHTRSLALVGKLFPTTDANHPQPFRTASFITQQDIAGEDADYINDAELRNAPDVHLWRRGSGVPILLITGMLFQRVDKEPSHRQLYQIAELGKPKSEPTRSPQFMRLLVTPEQPRIEGEALDFRDEIMAQIFDRGDATPRRSLTFNIEVTDEGSTHGTVVAQHRTFDHWRRIGKLTFDNAVVSYNGDFVIHFNHPTWRDERNDPATATRVNGQKVR